MSRSYNACRSNCCNNITKSVPQSSKTSDTDPNNLTAPKLNEKTEEDQYVKCSHVPFSLPLLDVPSTPPRTNTISPLLATEDENNDSSKLPGIDEEEGTETTNDSKNDEILAPKVSHSIKGYLDSYEATEMNLKLVAVFDCEYIRNNNGSHLDGGIKNDDI